MQEEWRPVVGYEGLYEVSNKGRVRSLKRKAIYPNGFVRTVPPKILKYVLNKDGYFQLSISKNAEPKTFRIHSLVASAFIGARPNGLVVDHINGDITNNTSINLQYLTVQENTLKGKSSLLKKNKHSKFTGVSIERRNKYRKWISYCRFEGKQKSLGYFKTELEAHNARQAFIKKHGIL